MNDQSIDAARATASSWAKVLWPIVVAAVSAAFSVVKWHSDTLDSKARVRVSNAQLVSTFFPALLSDSGSRRALALRAISHADAELAASLATALLSDPDSTVRTAAINTVTAVGLDSSGAARRQALNALVSQMYSPDSAGRISATTVLAREWRRDSSVVGAILAATRVQPRNGNGIFNAITVLGSLDASIRQRASADIRAFAELARRAGPIDSARADTLCGRCLSRPP
jgi:hypothetical protein